MEKTEILNSLQTVFNEVFDNEGSVVSEETTAQDISEWDSLTNIELMVAVEERFGVKFTAADIGKLQNVGDLVRLIRAKSGS